MIVGWVYPEILIVFKCMSFCLPPFWAPSLSLPFSLFPSLPPPLSLSLAFLWASLSVCCIQKEIQPSGISQPWYAHILLVLFAFLTPLITGHFFVVMFLYLLDKKNENCGLNSHYSDQFKVWKLMWFQTFINEYASFIFIPQTAKARMLC